MNKKLAFSAFAAMATIVVVVFGVLPIVFAFNGPSTSGGNGSGAIGVDSSNDVGIGTSTTSALGAKLVVVASSTGDASNYALKVLDSSGDPLIIVRNDGSIALGTATQNGAGTVTMGGNLFLTGNFNGTVTAGNVSAGEFGTGTSGGNFSFPARVGIGTVSPGYSLDVQGGQINASGGLCIGGYCVTSFPSGGSIGTVTGVTAGAGLSGGTITSTGTIAINFANANTWTATQTFSGSLCLGGVCNLAWPAAATTSSSQWSASGTAIYYDSGDVGIGTASPSYKLDVASDGATTARIGTSASDVLTVGGGSGKITAGTFDPAYSIGGQGFATYLPGMTGEKEETADSVQLAPAPGGGYQAILNFGSAPYGSDLWLFRSVIDASNNFQYVSVMLTPGFDGNVWYTNDAADNEIVIHGTAAGEVSYQLTGRRFDWQKWSNAQNGGADQGIAVPSNQ